MPLGDLASAMAAGPRLSRRFNRMDATGTGPPRRAAVSTVCAAIWARRGRGRDRGKKLADFASVKTSAGDAPAALPRHAGSARDHRRMRRSHRPGLDLMRGLFARSTSRVEIPSDHVRVLKLATPACQCSATHIRAIVSELSIDRASVAVAGTGATRRTKKKKGVTAEPGGAKHTAGRPPSIVLLITVAEGAILPSQGAARHHKVGMSRLPLIIRMRRARSP